MTKENTNKGMFIERRDIITVVAFIAIFILLGGVDKVKQFASGYDVVEKETTETIEYITKSQMDSVADFIIANQKSVPQRIVIQNGKVETVPEDYTLSEEQINQGNEIKTVNRYQDTIKLGNGTIFSDIYADNIYGKKFSLATTDTIVNKTTLEKRTIVKNGVFYGVGTTIGIDGRIKDIEGSVTYVHKNRFYIEGGVQYDIDPLISLPLDKRAGIKLKVGFNL